MSVLCLLVGAALLGDCAAIETSAPPSSPRAESPPPPTQTTKIDASQAERLKRIMVSLIQVMDHPRPLGQVKLGVLDDPQIKTWDSSAEPGRRANTMARASSSEAWAGAVRPAAQPCRPRASAATAARTCTS